MLKKVLKIKLKIVGIVVLSLVLIQLVTAYVFGFMAQKQLDLQFKHLTESPFVTVVSHDYHRGIFSSNSTTELAINSNMLAGIMKVLPSDSESANSSVSKTVIIKYTSHIQQGIFAGLINGYFMPTIAYVNTGLVYSDSLKKILAKFFNNKAPLTIENVLYLDKSGKFELYSPKFNYEEAVSGVNVVWGGLDLAIKYNSAFDAFKSDLNIPAFELSAPTKGALQLNNLTYQSNSKYSVNKIKVGNTSLNVGAIKIEWKDKIALNFKLGDILHSMTGISSTEFLNGIDAIDPSGFTLKNISYSSNSNDENNYFSADAIAKFESLTTNNKTYGPMTLDIKIDHVLSPQFSKLADKLSAIAAPTDESADSADNTQQQLISTVKECFGPILVDKPVITLNKFALNTPNGLIQLSGSATTNNFTPDDMNDPQKFMQKLVLDASFSLPKPVLSYLFILQMKYLLSAGNAEMDEQSSDALTKVVNILLDNQVNEWTKKGYLKNNNNVLSSHLVIKDGVLKLNGIVSK